MIPTLLWGGRAGFSPVRLIPGDICVMRLATGGGTCNPEVLKSCRWSSAWIGRSWCSSCSSSRAATFDFGKSMWTGRPIIEEIGLRFQLSLQSPSWRHHRDHDSPSRWLISAVKQNTWIDYGPRLLDRRRRMPIIWLGILIIPRHPDHVEGVVREPMDAADQVRANWSTPSTIFSMLIWPCARHRLSLLGVATRI